MNCERPSFLSEVQIDKASKTTIEIRLCVEGYAYFALVFIAGDQTRTVEANEELTDNINGIQSFLRALISDQPDAYLEVDRLFSIDCIYAQKLNDREVLLQIFELGYGHLNTNEMECPPYLYLEAVVDYRQFVGELYMSFSKLPPMARGLGEQHIPIHNDHSWCRIPEIEAWLNMCT